MNLSIRKISLLSLFGVALFAACKKQEYQNIEELDTANIEAYIRANNLQVEPLGNTGMYYQILEEGTGNDISYTGQYPLVYTVKSLDGVYSVADTFAATNRYFDYLGYFLGASPQGSSIASNPNYQGQLEKEEGLKMAIRTALKKTDGQIRVLIPSRLLSYGRNGVPEQGIPSNASMEYVIRVIDSASIPAYEDLSIQKRIEALGLSSNEYEKTESGIYYHINEMGEGDPILSLDSTLTLSYTAKLLNGAQIDQSDSVNYALRNLVRSWQEIVPKIRKGGQVHFFSPSSEAYGLGGGAVPFSSLEFDVAVKDN
ncbi:FKBP-type peptidyl-prolyl cis-trans isomerase [Olivibacter sp. XZL3]|uniref:FKBP-type peptidyl-prolyl cis-trans isomerase n=1 Tax=Olivibacter sp. XZL3 TaxID=1735116 RepID=UPI001064BD4C|nr:FKBP-type peptidyl-prolyl cis-trans isomerase [Olivibacter sp. XZL3]